LMSLRPARAATPFPYTTLFRSLLLFLGALEEPRLEHAHGLRTVLDLRALVLARHDETARQVGDPYRRVGRVDTLAAGARGAVDRSEEHTSELQSRVDLVCRLLL